MTTLVNMRNALRLAYPGEQWRKRVDKMSESQIFTLYTKFKLQGRIK